MSEALHTVLLVTTLNAGPNMNLVWGALLILFLTEFTDWIDRRWP